MFVSDKCYKAITCVIVMIFFFNITTCFGVKFSLKWRRLAEYFFKQALLSSLLCHPIAYIHYGLT